jgi:hypothetical protein
LLLIETITNTVEQIRTDNGYAAHVPEERQYVLESLSTFARMLSEAASTSIPYITHYCLDPLGGVSRRFAGAALGIAAYSKGTGKGLAEKTWNKSDR